MPIPDVIRELAASDSFLVTSHINPDGDAIGSTLGMEALLRAMGKKVVATSPDPVPERYRFLPHSDRILSPEKAKEFAPFQAVVVLDAGEFQRIGKVVDLITNETTVINIDHHVSNGAFGDVFWVEEDASAVAEMLHELFHKFRVIPDADTALALYVGIMTDTGRFRFSNTSSRCLATAAALVELGVDPAYAAQKVFYSKPRDVVETLGRFLARIEMHEDGKIALSYLTREESEVNSEGFIDHIASIQGIKLCALLREIEPDRYKVSFRSTNHVDVAAIAAEFGGGGHKKAAGCEIRGTTAEVKEKIVQACKKAMREEA